MEKKILRACAEATSGMIDAGLHQFGGKSVFFPNGYEHEFISDDPDGRLDELVKLEEVFSVAHQLAEAAEALGAEGLAEVRSSVNTLFESATFEDEA